MKETNPTHKSAGFGATKVHGVLLGVFCHMQMHNSLLLSKRMLYLNPGALSAPAPYTMRGIDLNRYCNDTKTIK